MGNSPSNGIPQAVTIHISLSNTACTSVDTFAIVHALLDRVDSCARQPDKVCDLTHLVSRTKKCRNFQLIFSLRSNFEIHNNNKSFSSMSQSQSIGGGGLKSRITTAKQPKLQLNFLFNFFSDQSV